MTTPTPDQLRKDAALMRDVAHKHTTKAGYRRHNETPESVRISEERAASYTRAAVALEEQATRMEQSPDA